MMPLQLSPVEARIVSPRRQPGRRTTSRLEQAIGLPAEHEHLRLELARLDGDNARQAAEIRRLREENQDLKKAAELWIRLYERQLARANDAVKAR